MITMRFCAPSPTSRRNLGRLFVVVGLGVMGVASCGVDQSGLGSMPFLPHDAASGDAAGIAGVTGSTGTAGTTGTTGTAGVTGTAGITATGVAGTGGDPSGSAGTSGGAGTAGTSGDAGTVGTAGITGTAGISGAAGMSGDVAGMSGGVAGSGGSGPAGVAGTIGTAGRGGSGGTGVAGTGGAAGGNVDAGSDGNADAGDGGMVTPCNPTTCKDGCCSGNTCVKARTAKLCGAMGAACAPCGGCQLCSTMGQCKIDSASRWTIVAVSAELPMQMSGRNWDRNVGDLGGSKPDPFCEFENPAGQVSTTTAGTTDTITDTYTPTWNQTITPVGVTVAASTLMSTNPTWQIWVGDDDGCSGIGGCLGDVACTIRQSITETQLLSGQLVVMNKQSCNSVTLGFVCQAPVAAGP